MTVLEEYATDLGEAVFDIGVGLARTVVYQGVSIAALVQFGPAPEAEVAQLGSKLHYLSQRAELWVQVAEVASPAAGDTWVYAGRTWTVQGIMAGDGAVWRLECYRVPRALPSRR